MLAYEAVFCVRVCVCVFVNFWHAFHMDRVGPTKRSTSYQTLDVSFELDLLPCPNTTPPGFPERLFWIVFGKPVLGWLAQAELS